MRFRAVSAQVLTGSSGSVGSRRRRSHGARRSSEPPIGARRHNRDLVMTFAAAWAADDQATLAALSTPDVTCRWSGFGSDPVVASGLAEVLVRGREFERHHGVADRYRVAETLSGVHHAAILFERDDAETVNGHGARIAVYRLDGDRIRGIAVYGDRLD